ncbi:MAG: N-acetylmuramoyl-L-alanine amidase [Clostridium sp.]|nr:N-acetylmuramoyl-L-alanine amidase [Clostridium sp.]
MTIDSFPLTVGGDNVPDERHLLTGVESGPMMPSADSVRYLILHCTATRADRDYPVERLLRDHKARGFRTVGYHFYVRRDGTVTQHRRLLEVGAHCRPYNRCSIGLCYEGGLDASGRPADTRTAEQTASLRRLFAHLHRLFPHAVVCGHRDMPGATPKACPCLDARAEFGSL